jgi:hypothetical protein
MEPEPVRGGPRSFIDPANTLVWFTMDALWLAKLTWPAYVAAVLTVATGVWLLGLSRKAGRGAVFADLGMNCWIAMNVIWMAHDLNGHETPRAVAAVLGALGVGFFWAAARTAQDIRRVRILRR